MGEGEADIIFKDLQDTLSTHRGDVAHFTQELREVCNFVILLYKELKLKMPIRSVTHLPNYS